MQTLHSRLSLSPSRFKTLYPNPTPTFLSLFSSLASLRHTHPTSPPSNPPFISNYLIETFAFSQPQALSILNRFKRAKTLEKPQLVVQFLKQLGFTDAHIRSCAHLTPQIIFSDVDKTLKPKLQLFQDMGLTGPDLGKFISKNSILLTISLEKKLLPCIDLIKKTLVNDKKNRDLIRVMERCNWVISKDPESRLERNIAFLESCGIVGSQLSMLLVRQPRLFVAREEALRDLVSRVLEMGFSVHSRMLVYGVYTVSCLSDETFSRKIELFRSFGFSKDECMEMFRTHPCLFRTSEEKLKFGIDFFLNVVKFERSVLVHRPNFLKNSMEERVIPRYRVLEVMKSKGLLKQQPSLLNVLSLPEEEFLEKYISRFRDDVEELLVAYKGHLLDSSMKKET